MSDVCNRSKTNQGPVSFLQSRQAVISRGEFYWIFLAATDDVLRGGQPGLGSHVLHVINKTSTRQLARNTGYSVRVNHKVSTTAAASNKQVDVKFVNFGLVGSNNLVIDVSICCDHVGNSTVNNRHLNGKIHTNEYLQARAGVKNRRYKDDHAAVSTAFAPAIVSVAGQIHPKFFCLLWVLADKQTRNYYALIGAEEEIGSKAFTWSRARTFSFNKNSIGKAIAYATATRLHLSVHSTAPPLRHQPGQPISSAECLMHGAAHASHRAWCMSLSLRLFMGVCACLCCVRFFKGAGIVEANVAQWQLGWQPCWGED